MIVNVEIQILGRSLLLSVSMYSDIILEDLFQLCSVCACVSAHGYMHVSEVPTGARKDLGSLEPELEVAVSCPVCMLGTALRSSGRAASSPKPPPPRNISPAA